MDPSFITIVILSAAAFAQVFAEYFVFWLVIKKW